MQAGGPADGPRQPSSDPRIQDLLHSLGIDINTGDSQHLRDGLLRLAALYLQKQDTGTAAFSRMSAATAMLRASLRAASQAGWLLDQEGTSKHQQHQQHQQHHQHSSAAPVQIKAEVINDGSLAVQRIHGSGVTGELVQVYRFVYEHAGTTELYFIVDDSVLLAGYGFDSPEVQRSVSGTTWHVCCSHQAPIGCLLCTCDIMTDTCGYAMYYGALMCSWAWYHCAKQCGMLGIAECETKPHTCHIPDLHA